MTHASLLVGDYLIAKGNGELTPMHINKLTYISHGWTLALLNENLISDEVQAWRYGPVIPSIYHNLKSFASNKVNMLMYCDTPLSDIVAIAERVEFFKNTVILNKIKIIDKVFDTHKHFTGNQLSGITHKKGSPWYTHHKKGVLDIIIPNEDIKQYYKQLAEPPF